jgi:hypothetical protein
LAAAGNIEGSQKREECMTGLVRTLCVSPLVASASAGIAWAEPVMPFAAAPEAVGLSSSQLAQVDDRVRIMLRNQFRTMVQAAIIN